MNDRQLKALLKNERRQIDLELRALERGSFFSVHRTFVAVAIAVLVFSGIAFAAYQMTVAEWIRLETMGYEGVLKNNPECQLEMSVEDQDITLTIDGLAADRLNTYLYYHAKDKNGKTYRIQYMDGLVLENVKVLYPSLKDQLIEEGMPEEYVDENFDHFYLAGSATLANANPESNLMVMKFDPFENAVGSINLLVTTLVGPNEETITGTWRFEIPYEQAYVETLELDGSHQTRLPYKDILHTLEFQKMERGITATRLTYTDSTDDEKYYVAYENFQINGQPLRSIFLSGGFGEEIKTIDFFPIEVEKIRSISCEIDSVSTREPVIADFQLSEFPATVDYKGHPLIIEESFTDRYVYAIKDPDYAERDYEYLEFDIFFGRDNPIMHQEFDKGYLVLPDGSKLPYQSFVDPMIHPDAVVRTSRYQLETHESDEELRAKDYYSYTGESATRIQVRKEHKTYPIHQPVQIYKASLWDLLK